MKVLTINPGSTTTKIALFEDENLIFEKKLDHAADPEFQEKFTKPQDIFNQFDYRLNDIINILTENQVVHLDAVVGRGGMLPPVTSGTYQVNEKMVDDLKNHAQASHASNLGGALALEVAKKFKIETMAFIVDPVTTDELEDKHKITGIPHIKRYAAWHALNQKAVAREYSKDISKPYNELNLIVAHLGGGSSFGAHKKGRVINVINALAGEGPFTPERAGAIPAQGLVELCFSGKYSKEQCIHLIAGGGGIFAHLGTKSMMEIEENYPKFNKEQRDIIDEMIAGISRAICSLIPDFEGEKVDQILITGGIARCPLVVNKVKQDLTALNMGITVYPGEKELEALRDGALRVLRHEEQPKNY